MPTPDATARSAWRQVKRGEREGEDEKKEENEEEEKKTLLGRLAVNGINFRHLIMYFVVKWRVVGLVGLLRLCCCYPYPYQYYAPSTTTCTTSRRACCMDSVSKRKRRWRSSRRMAGAGISATDHHHPRDGLKGSTHAHARHESATREEEQAATWPWPPPTRLATSGATGPSIRWRDWLAGWLACRRRRCLSLSRERLIWEWSRER